MKDDKEVTVVIDNYMMFDSIYNLAREYSLSVEFLINVAIKRLIDDIDDIRQLRNNDYKL